MKAIKPRGRKKGKFFIFIVILTAFTAYSFMFAEKVVKPAISSMAEVKVKSIVSQLVNESIHKEFSQDIDMDKLLIIKTDEGGKVSIVQSNAVLMNQLAAELSLMIHNRLRELEPTKLKVPMGSVLGSQILSQSGPTVDLKILPLGATKVNFKTEFESKGINQTRYKVFLEAETQAKVIIPFAEKNVVLSYVVPVVETVIVGDVPQSYVMVPSSSEIMDGMNMGQ